MAEDRCPACYDPSTDVDTNCTDPWHVGAQSPLSPDVLRAVARQLRANWEFATGKPGASLSIDVPDAAPLGAIAADLLADLLDAIGDPDAVLDPYTPSDYPQEVLARIAAVLEAHRG